MENFESPSSPINLSSRLIERNVLKELNSIEGANKSNKQQSEDLAIHSKDVNNLSNNLPDIVTNVNFDINKAINRNLLSVATTPDIQSSDEEYVDCNSTLKSDVSPVGVNKTIENVSKILDETTQNLEELDPTPNDFNATVCVPNTKHNDGFIDITKSLTDKSNSETNTDTSLGNDLNITQHQSKDTIISSQLTDVTRTTSSTENCDVVTTQSVCESVLSEHTTKSTKAIDPIVESNEFNESVDITSLFGRLAIVTDDGVAATTSTAGCTVDSNVPATESSVGISSVTIDPVAPEIDCQNDYIHEPSHAGIYEKIQTKVDVELSQTHILNNFHNAEDSSTCQEETTFILTDNAINSTVVLESNPKDLRNETETAGTEAEFSNDNAELKQVEKFRADSIDLNDEIHDTSLNSLESKEPVTTPTKKCLPYATAEEVFSSKKSSPLSEMFPSSGQSTNELNTGGNFSCQDTFPVAFPITDNERDVPLAGDKDELVDVTSFNEKIDSSRRCHVNPYDKSPSTSTDNCLTDIAAEKVFSSKKSPNLSEMFPETGRTANEFIATNNFPRQNIFSVDLPVTSNESDVPVDCGKNELRQEDSPNKSSTSDKINYSDGIHHVTFDLSRSLDSNHKSTALPKKLRNTDSPPTSKMSEIRAEGDFQFKKPTLPTSTCGKLNNEQLACGDDSSFMVLNSNDFDFLQSRGANCSTDPENNRRDSLLLRFDPLVGRSVYTTQLVPTVETVETAVGIEQDLQKTEPILDLCSNSSGENSSDEQHSLKKQSHATNAAEMSVGLVRDSNNMDKETNSSDDKHIAVDGVSLNDKKIKLEYTDGNIKKKMEEYEATQEILVKRLTEKEKTLSKNCAIIEAYEKALAELVAEKEKLTENYETINERLRNERDIHYQHLMSLENTFSDLHMKYERSKDFTVQLQERLDLLTEEKAKIDELLKQQEARYEKMKQHALHQLEYANSTLEEQEKNNSRENSRLKALLKIEEVSRNTIHEQLLQKCKENDELVKICDELIGGQKS